MSKYDLTKLIDQRGVAVGANEQGNFNAVPGSFNPDTGDFIPLDQPQALIQPPAQPAQPAPATTSTAPQASGPPAGSSAASGYQAPTASKNEKLYLRWADAQPTAASVETEDTVAGQLKSLLSSDSPYLTAARQAGLNTAAKRGLLNSSMAAGASEASAIQAAMPAARQDASTYFSQKINNQNARNTFSLALKKAGLTGVIETDKLSMKLAQNYAIFLKKLDVEYAKIGLGQDQIAANWASAQLTAVTNLTNNGATPSQVSNVLNFTPAQAASSTNNYASLYNGLGQ